MTKLIEFPIPKKQVTTWAEGIQAMLDNADETTKNTPIRNILIISEDDHDYSFGLLNDKSIRNMIGTLECIKAYFILMLQNVSTYDYPDD